MASTLRRLVLAVQPCRSSRKPSLTANSSALMPSNMLAPSTTSTTAPPSPSIPEPMARSTDEPHHQGSDRQRFYDETHDELREHLANFVAAYNFAKRLKTLQGLTPYEFICKSWIKEAKRFTSNLRHQIPGPN